jgi:hypothetical protein
MTTKAQRQEYAAQERRGYEYWMRIGSQPGLLNSMTAAEHRKEAARGEMEAAKDEAEAKRLEARARSERARAGRLRGSAREAAFYAAASWDRAAHAARLNAAKYMAHAMAHREMMGRRYLMEMGTHGSRRRTRSRA